MLRAVDLVNLCSRLFFTNLHFISGKIVLEALDNARWDIFDVSHVAPDGIIL